MKSNTKKDLVFITNVEKNKFYNKLQKELNFEKDKRIKFVGTVYEEELLKKIRENAYAYIHGHSVGGTNPSLLEALSATQLNILYDVGFNREVGQDACIYWSKKTNNLKEEINKADKLKGLEIEELNKKAKKIIKENYSWEEIIKKYEKEY